MDDRGKKQREIKTLFELEKAEQSTADLSPAESTASIMRSIILDHFRHVCHGGSISLLPVDSVFKSTQSLLGDSNCIIHLALL